MFPREDFIESFGLLGDFLDQFPRGTRRDEGDLNSLNRVHYQKFLMAIDEEKVLNPWFTGEWVLKALSGISHMLRRDGLRQWLKAYPDDQQGISRTVGLVLAGNIPLVGFHDVMCVLASGHRLLARASSKDDRLIRIVAEILESIHPDLGKAIAFTDEKLLGIDAVIATGSNNSARHFEYYFRKIPHIIRRNRNGVAVLTGSESREELEGLGEDIFTYFGMGCRNVSKLWVPEDYDLTKLMGVMDDFGDLARHHKYMNNVDYQRSLYLMNQLDFLDNGVLLLREDTAIASPVGVVFYERYSEISRVAEELDSRQDEIQCMVSVHPGLKNCIAPGSTQRPGAGDYADGVDTLRFLNQLK